MKLEYGDGACFVGYEPAGRASRGSTVKVLTESQEECDRANGLEESGSATDAPTDPPTDSTDGRTDRRTDRRSGRWTQPVDETDHRDGGVSGAPARPALAALPEQRTRRPHRGRNPTAGRFRQRPAGGPGGPQGARSGRRPRNARHGAAHLLRLVPHGRPLRVVRDRPDLARFLDHRLPPDEPGRPLRAGCRHRAARPRHDLVARPRAPLRSQLAPRAPRGSAPTAAVAGALLATNGVLGHLRRGPVRWPPRRSRRSSLVAGGRPAQPRRVTQCERAGSPTPAAPGSRSSPH